MALDFGAFGSFAKGALGAAGGAGGGAGGGGYGASESGSTAQQITPTITIGGLRTSGGQSVSTKASQSAGDNPSPSTYGGENGMTFSTPGTNLGVGLWVALAAVGMLAFGSIIIAAVKR